MEQNFTPSVQSCCEEDSREEDSSEEWTRQKSLEEGTVFDHKEKSREEEIEYIGSKEKSLAKTGKDIFIRFPSILRTARVYEPNNLTFLKQFNSLFTLIQNTLKNEGKVQFQLRESTLFFNAITVKYEFSTYNSLKLLVDEFRKREIGILSFEQGLDEDELKQFVVLFAKTEPKKENPFEDFKAKIEAAGISHISLKKMHPFEILRSKEAEHIKRHVKKVFFKSIVDCQHF